MRRSWHWLNVRVLPRGWHDLLRQVVLFVFALVLYNLVRGLVDGGNLYKPFGDAMRIIDFERAVHIFVEPSVQAWAQNKRWMMDAADWTYLNGHFLVTLLALAYIYLRHNKSFYFIRNVFMVAMALALVGYWLYPTAPPRLLPEWGFTDSISQFLVGSTGHVDTGAGKAFLNFYAAVPSMHVCFAVIIGVAMVRLVSWRAAKVAWALYPVFVTWVVVVTANHFFIDVFLGALTAVAAAYLAKGLLARARPDVWAFAPAPA